MPNRFLEMATDAKRRSSPASEFFHARRSLPFMSEEASGENLLTRTLSAFEEADRDEDDDDDNDDRMDDSLCFTQQTALRKLVNNFRELEEEGYDGTMEDPRAVPPTAEHRMSTGNSDCSLSSVQPPPSRRRATLAGGDDAKLKNLLSAWSARDSTQRTSVSSSKATGARPQFPDKEKWQRFIEDAHEKACAAELPAATRIAAANSLRECAERMYDMLADFYTAVTMEERGFVHGTMRPLLPEPTQAKAAARARSSGGMLSTTISIPFEVSCVGFEHGRLSSSTAEEDTTSASRRAGAVGARPSQPHARHPGGRQGTHAQAFVRSRRSSCTRMRDGTEVINGYAVKRMLGRGMTGVVLLCVDARNKTLIAVKTVAKPQRQSYFATVQRARGRVSDSFVDSSARQQRHSSVNGASVVRGHRTSVNAAPTAARPPATSTPENGTLIGLFSPATDGTSVSGSTAATASATPVAVPVPRSEDEVASAAVDLSATEISGFNASTSTTLRGSSASSRDSKRSNGLRALVGPRAAPSVVVASSPTALPTFVWSSGAAGVPAEAPACSLGDLGGEAAGREEDARASPRQEEMTAVEREIRVLRRLHHPGIVQLLEVIDDDEEGAVHMVLEYLPNGPITMVAQYDGELGYARCEVVRPLSRLTQICRELIDALRYLQSRRIVHNDIKPENILFNVDGRAVLTDFGESVLLPATLVRQDLNASVALGGTRRWGFLSGQAGRTASCLSMQELGVSSALQSAQYRSLYNQSDILQSESSMVLSYGVDTNGKLEGRVGAGTPAFCAPELVGHNECSFKTDIWSFGVVLYGMLFGRLPFAGNTISETFDAVLNKELAFPPLTQIPSNTEFDEEGLRMWTALCSSMLARNPAERVSLSALAVHPQFRPGSVTCARSDHTTQSSSTPTSTTPAMSTRLSPFLGTSSDVAPAPMGSSAAAQPQEADTLPPLPLSPAAAQPPNVLQRFVRSYAADSDASADGSPSHPPTQRRLGQRLSYTPASPLTQVSSNTASISGGLTPNAHSAAAAQPLDATLKHLTPLAMPSVELRKDGGFRAASTKSVHEEDAASATNLFISAPREPCTRAASPSGPVTPRSPQESRDSSRTHSTACTAPILEANESRSAKAKVSPTGPPQPPRSPTASTGDRKNISSFLRAVVGRSTRTGNHRKSSVTAETLGGSPARRRSTAQAPKLQ